MSLNKRQKTVLLVGMTIAILCGLFPPWKAMVEFDAGRKSYYFQGYHVLFTGPEKIYPGLKLQKFRANLSIEWERLVIQWILLCIVVITGVLFFNEDTKPSPD